MSGIKNKKIISYEDNHRLNKNKIIEKLCNRCNKWLPCTQEYFHKNKCSPDGLFPYCKECNIKASSKRQEENKEYLSGYMKEYYINNIDTMIENAKRANKSNPEQYKLKQSEYRHNNKDKMIEYTKRYSNKKHNITKTEWGNCLSYFNYSCAYCGMTQEEAKEKYGQYLHREHVDHNGSNGIDNCVPACKGCNSEKHQDKLEIWYNESNSKFDHNRLNKVMQWITEDYKTVIKKVV